jgi:hypothetical protein
MVYTTPLEAFLSDCLDEVLIRYRENNRTSMYSAPIHEDSKRKEVVEKIREFYLQGNSLNKTATMFHVSYMFARSSCKGIIRKTGQYKRGVGKKVGTGRYREYD